MQICQGALCRQLIDLHKYEALDASSVKARGCMGRGSHLLIKWVANVLLNIKWKLSRLHSPEGAEQATHPRIGNTWNTFRNYKKVTQYFNIWYPIK